MYEDNFQTLNLSNAFAFSVVMDDPEICRKTLECILEIPVGAVRASTEKGQYYRKDTRGIRLDVYAVEGGKRHFNVEMQTVNRGNLPERSRFHQSEMDVLALKPGQDFQDLPDNFVIFICTFDPFGKGNYIYTFENRCREGNFPLGDRTRKIFLNTKGKNPESISPEILQFLKFVECSTEKTARESPENQLVQELYKRISQMKNDRGMERQYMLLDDLLNYKFKDGFNQGIQQNKEEFRKLKDCMENDGLLDELPRLISDDEFYEEMKKRYQI